MVSDLPMLRAFATDIWLAYGPELSVAGFRYPTRAAIVRLLGGRLLVWSPVALSPALRAAVDALGDVCYLVAPNSLHHLFLADWRSAYPAARLYAPPGLREKRRDLVFDADLGEEPDPEWSGELDQVPMRGNLLTTEVVFFHAKSRTVLFADLIQRIDPGSLAGWRALVARLDLMTGPEPQVPRKFRLVFVDRRSARRSLERVLVWPADKVIMAHADPVLHDGQAFIKRAFRWLSG